MRLLPTLILAFLFCGNAIAQMTLDAPDFGLLQNAVVVPNGETMYVCDELEQKIIAVHGTLEVCNHLRGVTIYIYSDGKIVLKSGADLEFMDMPIDLEKDPVQWGNGLVCKGEFEAHGTPKMEYVRATASLVIGDVQFVSDVIPVGWNIGDELIICDTQQTPWGYPYIDRNEVVRVVSVTDTTVVFDPPLKYDHPGLAPNELQLIRFAPVGNLTRDIVVRSENPMGTRGHVVFMGDAKVDNEYALFKNLGRSRAEQLGPSKLDINGGVVPGPNQPGRYPVHYHKMRTQVRDIGTVVDGSDRWGKSIHDTCGGIFHRGIVTHCRGAGLVTEQGTETGNYITENLWCAISGNRTEKYSDPHGHGSDGGWFAAPGNFIDRNLSFGNQGSGYYFNGYGRTPPAFDKIVTVHPGEPYLQPLLSFDRNEAGANCNSALWFTWSEGQQGPNHWPRQTISDFVGWHNRNGLEGFHEGAMTLSRFVAIADPAVSKLNQGSSDIEQDRGFGIKMSGYEWVGLEIDEPFITGYQVGIYVDSKIESEGLKIIRPNLANHVNIAPNQQSQFPFITIEDPIYGTSDVGPGVKNYKKSLPDEHTDVYKRWEVAP